MSPLDWREKTSAQTVERAWQIMTYRRGDYRAKLELPPEYSGRLDLRYSYSVTLMWPTIGPP